LKKVPRGLWKIEKKEAGVALALRSAYPDRARFRALRAPQKCVLWLDGRKLRDPFRSLSPRIELASAQKSFDEVLGYATYAPSWQVKHRNPDVLFEGQYRTVKKAECPQTKPAVVIGGAEAGQVFAHLQRRKMQGSCPRHTLRSES
jgi:hypothetical protein